MDGMNEGWQRSVPALRERPPAAGEAEETPSPWPGYSPVPHLPSCVPFTFKIKLGREDACSLRPSVLACPEIPCILLKHEQDVFRWGDKLGTHLLFSKQLFTALGSWF